MNWFAEHRQAWILETIYIYGFINRDHIMRKFNVSRPQASSDLTHFRREYASIVEYSLTRKRYELRDHPAIERLARS